MNLNITQDEIMNLSYNEAETLMKLAIGRVFRMLDRENKTNDSDDFDKCSLICKYCNERIEILKIKQFVYDRKLHDFHKLSTSLLFN